MQSLPDIEDRRRFALVGCGAAGKVHAFHFSRNLHFACEVCVDADISKAREFQKEFGFRQCEEILDNISPEGVQILSIASPPAFHASQIQWAAQRGVHVLCEKPLFMNKEEAEMTFQTRKKNNVLLGVMLPRRFYNCSLAAKKALEEKRLGSIQSVKFTLECAKNDNYYEGWRGRKEMCGGGVLMSQAIHSIDQLVFLFGKARAVSGQVWTKRKGINVEDEAQAEIQFMDDVTVSVFATTHSEKYPWKGITEIEGSRGRIVLDSENCAVWDVSQMPSPPDEEAEDIPERFKPVYYGPGHLKVIRNFAGAVRGAEILRAPGEETMEALRIIWGIYQSSETGKQVALAE